MMQHICSRLHIGPGIHLIEMALIIAISSLLLSGCTGQKTVNPESTPQPGKVVYAVTQADALKLAQWAVAQVFPEQHAARLRKPRIGFVVHEKAQKGHAEYARFRETIFIYEIDLIRLGGTNAQGRHVVGYTYTVKGDGQLKTGPGKLNQLDQRLKQAFESTGSAVALSSPQHESPPSPPSPPAVTSAPPTVPKANTGPPKAPAASATSRKPVKKETPSGKHVAEQPSKADVFQKLKKLKTLYDRGIITEQEFQTKKKELLSRI